MSKTGILALARPTFDVEYAQANFQKMLAALERSGVDTIGPKTLLMDGAQADAAIGELSEKNPDRILILQVTFTDAAMVVEVANRFDLPLSIWSIPEPRIGGRLRLNSFCGLNLAGHALGLAGREFGYLYSAPDAADIDKVLVELLSGERNSKPVQLAKARDSNGTGKAAVEALRGAKIGRIGAHPVGFDTCAYDKNKLQSLAEISVDELELPELFDRAGQVSDEAASVIRNETENVLGGLGEVDQSQLSRSLKLKNAIDAIKSDGDYDAFAIRCWPETFTEYGGAVCGPVSMMGEARVPCACEADVYGALTSLLLQKVADAPAFLTDLVDLDIADDTGVVWHCGQAPISMADPDVAPHATIHTNRKMPLLFEFPLKPGRVTIFRISQARGQTFAVIGGGEMLQRPMAFTGTSGVVRFDSGAAAVLDKILGAALEHHMAIAYGDHREPLQSAASALGVPVLEL
ncbi:MAG: L-fucose/L-arabinose isomerase family protein [Rhizobiaceae bacterium]